MKKLIFLLTSLCVFSLLFVGFFHPVTAFTQDLGRHLLLGKIILTTHAVPKINLLSYTYPTYPFINHHYLSEVFFYLINHFFGMTGLLSILTIIVLLAYGIVFFYSVYKTSLLPVTILSFFYLNILFERTDIRPEMFGYLLLSSFIVLLYHYREQYTKWILLLLPLELVWVQLHISFIIGIGVIGLFFLDNLWLHRKKLNNESTKLLFLVLLSSTLITFLNPNGIAGTLYPFHIFQNYGYTIEENQNIFFLESLFFKPTIPYFKLAVLLLFISLLSVIKKTKPIDWLLALTFTYLGASAVRNFPLFVFATLLPASIAFSEIGNWIKAQIKNPWFHQARLFSPLLIGIIFLFRIPPTIAMHGFGTGDTVGARNAADFYVKNHLKGPVFNNFDIGSYLVYRIYPAQKVFLDGRPEAYPASFLQQTYIPMQENPQFFAVEDKKYRFNTIFFAHTDQTPWARTFLQAIMNNPSWVPLYLDHDVIILVKNTPENAPLIKQFGMTRATLIDSQIQTYSQRELFQLANFYALAQLPPQLTNVMQEILQKDPHNCQALSFLLSQQSQSPNPLYTEQFARFCQ